MEKNLLYRSIPKLDEFLEDEKIKQMIEVYGRDIVIDAIRVEMDRLRKFIEKCDSEEEAREQVQNLIEQIRLQAEKIFNQNMKKIIFIAQNQRIIIMPEIKGTQRIARYAG